jgi:hypothetical protein
MAEQRQAKSCSKGTAKHPSEPDLKVLLQQYLAGLADQEVTDANGTGPTLSMVASLDSEERLTPSHPGQPCTTTGVVSIMREDRNVESAALLAELQQTYEESQKLLTNLKDLHRRKTGTYPKPSKLRSSESR